MDDIAFGNDVKGMGYLDVTPAATLLLPYFEVDFQQPAGLGMDTEVVLHNQSPSQAIAHLMFFTTLGVPTESMDLVMAPHSSETFLIGDLFRGTVPQGNCNGAYLGDMIPLWHAPDISVIDLVPAVACPIFSMGTFQAFHTGMPSPHTGLCGDLGSTGSHAVGFLLIDHVKVENAGYPWESGYFVQGGLGRASNANVLSGWFSLIDPQNNQAIGNSLVHIEASSTHTPAITHGTYTFYGAWVNETAADNRESLATRWGFNFSLEAPVENANLIYWRDTKRITAPMTCGTAPAWFPLDTAEVVIFAADGTSELLPSLYLPFPAQCGMVALGSAAFPVSPSKGSIAVDFNDVPHPTLFGTRSQGIVMPLFSTLGRFQSGFTGFQLDNALEPEDKDSGGAR